MRLLTAAIVSVALAQAGFAANSWINQGCDIATTSQIDTSKSQWFLNQGGSVTFTLSKDFTLAHNQIYAQSVLYNNSFWYARCIYDFRDGDHVLTANSGFFVYGIAAAGTSDECHKDDIYASHEFLGGTWDMNGKNLQFGGQGSQQCDHMIITADGTTFRNMAVAYLLRKTYNSKADFSNGAELKVSAGDKKEVYGFCPHSNIDINNEIVFRDRAKVSCGDYYDSLNGGGIAEQTLSQDWKSTTTITGEGTAIDASGNIHFSARLGGLTTVIDDKAVVASVGNAIFGNNLTAHDGTLIIDNGAKLNCYNFRMGATYLMMENMTLRIGDGAELHVTDQFMSAGKGNSLEIDNGTLMVDGQYAFYLGFYDGDIVSSGYSLTFKGESPRIITGGDTQIRRTHVTIELKPGHTYTEPFITGKRQVFIADKSTIELKNAKEYCQQLTASVDIPLLYDAEKTSAYLGGDETLVGFPDGAKLQRNADGNYVYLHLEPAGCAKVGGRVFDSFEEAAAATEAGGTVELIRDTEVSKVGVFGAKDKVTLDLAGRTLTDTAQYFQFNKGGATTVTLANSASQGGVFKVAGGNWMTGWQDGTEGSTVIIDSGVTVDLGEHSIFEGHVYGNQLVHVKKGGAISSTGSSFFYIGYTGSYNTLLVEGTVSFGGILLGHPKEATGEPTYGAKLIVRGQDAAVDLRYAPIFPMSGSFGGIDGEIVYDDCTIDNSDKSLYWYSDTPAFTGNQLTLMNGARVKFKSVCMGRDETPAIEQRVFVGEDSTLEVSDGFSMAGRGNTLVISNGTLQAASQNAFSWGQAGNSVIYGEKNNSIVLVGTKPQLRATDANARVEIHGTAIAFDLTAGIYGEAPLWGDWLELHDDNEISFRGIGTIVAKFENGGYGKVDHIDIPLMKSSKASGCYFLSARRRAVLNAMLPHGVGVAVNASGSEAVLRIRRVHRGTLIEMK